MKKLVIIPAYNESGSILQAVKDIREHAPGFDYLVINDCSTDDTLDICRREGLNYVNLSVNLGNGGAVQSGYLYACRNGYVEAGSLYVEGGEEEEYYGRKAEGMGGEASETWV